MCNKCYQENKGTNTTEIITVCAAVAAFLAGTDIIHIDLNHIVDTAKQVKDISEGVDISSIDSIIEGVYKIICIILGGSIVTHYIRYKKARDTSIIIQKVEQELDVNNLKDIINEIISKNSNQNENTMKEETKEPEIVQSETIQEQTQDVIEDPIAEDENEGIDVVEDVGDDNVTYPLRRV